MPKLVNKLPGYRLHKASGRAVVRSGGKDVYLPGPYGSKQSREAYGRFLAELARQPESPLSKDAPTPELLSISELILLYSEHAENYYRKDGKPTGEHVCIRYAIRPLESLFGLTLAAEFGPKKLKTVREEMIRLDWTRRHINASVRRIGRMFRWAGEEELLPGEIASNLRAVQGLKKDRSAAREKPAIGTVSDEHVRAALPFVSARVRDLVMVTRLSGMRPGESLSLAIEAIDRTDPECWVYRPESHKTSHHGRGREIYLGPKCREILLPRIVSTGSGRLFPITRRSFHKAVVEACDRAGIPRWFPNMLRHSFATEVRRRFGLEGAQAALGHAKAEMTETYAEVDHSKARDVARMVG